MAVAQLGVGESVVHVAFLVGFHGGKGSDGLAQHREGGHLHRGLADLCLEGFSFDADEVAAVEELFEDVVVHGLVLARAQFVAVQVDLQRAFVVLQFRERGLAHDSSGHEAASEFDLHAFLEMFLEGRTVMRHRKSRGGIGVDASCTERVH